MTLRRSDYFAIPVNGAKRMLVWGGIGLLWGFFLLLVVVAYFTHEDGAGDALPYFMAAQNIAGGEAIYAAEIKGMIYLYPPLLAESLSPIVANTSGQGIKTIWFIVNLILLFLTTWLLAREVRPHHRYLVWLFVPAFSPFLMALWHGQATIVMLTFIVGAWIALKYDRPMLAGILLAAAAWTKVYPAIIIAYFIWKRDWRLTLGAIGGGLILAIIQVFGVGWSNMQTYFTLVLPRLASVGQPHLAYFNHSTYGLGLRLFADVPQVTPLFVNNMLLNLTRWGLLAVMAIVLTWYGRLPMTRTAAPQRDIEYAMIVLFALLFSSSLGHSSLTPLLLVYVLLATHTPHKLQFPMRILIFLTIFITSLHMFVVIGSLEPPSNKTMHSLLLSGPTLSLLAVWATLAYIHSLAHVPANASNEQTAALE